MLQRAFESGAYACRNNGCRHLEHTAAGHFAHLILSVLSATTAHGHQADCRLSRIIGLPISASMLPYAKPAGLHPSGLDRWGRDPESPPGAAAESSLLNEHYVATNTDRLGNCCSIGSRQQGNFHSRKNFQAARRRFV
jgi:hypothetical protein